MAGPAQRDVHRLHRHAGGQDGLRQGDVQDLRLRGRQGLPAQIFHRREHRGRHHAAALLQPRAERDARAARDHGEGVPRAGRDRGHRRHRGAEQDPRPGGEPEELPQGQGARGEGGASTWPTTTGRTSSRWATRRFSSAWTARPARFYKEALDAILPPEYSEIVYTGNNNDPPHLEEVAPRREDARSRSARTSPRSASGRRS